MATESAGWVLTEIRGRGKMGRTALRGGAASVWFGRPVRLSGPAYRVGFRLALAHSLQQDCGVESYLDSVEGNPFCCR